MRFQQMPPQTSLCHAISTSPSRPPQKNEDARPARHARLISNLNYDSISPGRGRDNRTRPRCGRDRRAYTWRAGRCWPYIGCLRSWGKWQTATPAISTRKYIEQHGILDDVLDERSRRAGTRRVTSGGRRFIWRSMRPSYATGYSLPLVTNYHEFSETLLSLLQFTSEFCY